MSIESGRWRSCQEPPVGEARLDRHEAWLCSPASPGQVILALVLGKGIGANRRSRIQQPNPHGESAQTRSGEHVGHPGLSSSVYGPMTEDCDQRLLCAEARAMKPARHSVTLQQQKLPLRDRPPGADEPRSELSWRAWAGVAEQCPDEGHPGCRPSTPRLRCIKTWSRPPGLDRFYVNLPWYCRRWSHQ